MQPHSMTSVMQLIVTVCAVTIAAFAIIFTVWTWRAHCNADLVRIGVSVLRVDPEKEKQISDATRKWALDLIDANAGVTFSPEARQSLLEARQQLLKEPLNSFEPYYADPGFASGNWGSDSVPGAYPNSGDIPAQRQSSPKPQK